MIAAEWLYDALAASPDDAQRAALIDAAPRDVRDALAALMAYRRLVAPTRNDALDAFRHALSTATDDAARLAIINAADVPVVAAFRDELWWQKATVEDAHRRYMALIEDQT
jgi:hypothetical protein